MFVMGAAIVLTAAAVLSGRFHVQAAGLDVTMGTHVDRGFVVHTGDFHCDGATLDISHDFCLTATRDILLAIASDEAPRESVMALGYSGWGAGQLENEIAENAWIISDPIPDLVYGVGHDTKWSRALELIGIDAARLHSAGGNA